MFEVLEFNENFTLHLQEADSSEDITSDIRLIIDGMLFFRKLFLGGLFVYHKWRSFYKFD